MHRKVNILNVLVLAFLIMQTPSFGHDVSSRTDAAFMQSKDSSQPSSRIELPKKSLPRQELDRALILLPDLFIRVMRADPTTTQTGEPIELLIELENIGNAPVTLDQDQNNSPDAVLHIGLVPAGTSLGSLLDNEESEDEYELLKDIALADVLAAGDSLQFRETIAIADEYGEGSHAICAIADPENNVAERNENNNQRCVAIITRIAPDADGGMSYTLEKQLPNKLPQEKLQPLPEKKKK